MESDQVSSSEDMESDQVSPTANDDCSDFEVVDSDSEDSDDCADYHEGYVGGIQSAANDTAADDCTTLTSADNLDNDDHKYSPANVRDSTHATNPVSKEISEASTGAASNTTEVQSGIVECLIDNSTCDHIVDESTNSNATSAGNHENDHHEDDFESSVPITDNHAIAKINEDPVCNQIGDSSISATNDTTEVHIDKSTAINDDTADDSTSDDKTADTNPPEEAIAAESGAQASVNKLPKDPERYHLMANKALPPQ